MPIKQSVQIAVQPSEEPLSLSQVKQWLREDDTGQDDVIGDLIAAARELVEARTGRATVSTTYRQALDRFPIFLGNEAIVGYPVMPSPIVHSASVWPLSPNVVSIQLMRSPLIEVTSFQYYDNDGNLQTLTEDTDFVTDADSEPARLDPAPSGFWPATQFRAPAAFITYTAGYASASAVPGVMKQAMRMLIAHWYEHRETVSDDKLMEVPEAVGALLDSCRIRWEW